MKSASILFKILLSLSLIISLDLQGAAKQTQVAQKAAQPRTRALSAQACEKYIAALGKLIDSKPEKPRKLDLPDPYLMKITQARAGKMAEIADKGWDSFYDSHKLKKILEKVAKGESLRSSEAKYLKKLRKRSLMIKSVVQILGDDHRPPHRLSSFNSKLGLLNDEHPKRPGYNAQALANDLLGMLRSLKWHFKPSADVEKYFNKRKDKIMDMVKKGSLDDESLHSVRKKIRQLMMVTYLNHVIQPTKAGESQVEYLHALSRALAQLRSSHQQYYQIPHDLQRQILKALDSLEVES